MNNAALALSLLVSIIAIGYRYNKKINPKK